MFVIRQDMSPAVHTSYYGDMNGLQQFLDCCCCTGLLKFDGFMEGSSSCCDLVLLGF